MDESSRTNYGFRSEVDEILYINFFLELNEKELNQKLQVSESILSSRRTKSSIGNEKVKRFSNLSKHLLTDSEKDKIFVLQIENCRGLV